MIIGKFTQQGEVYAGSMFGIGFAIPYVVFSPVPAKPTQPDFVVFGSASEEDGEFELGAAWAKTSKAGKPYISVKLDGPMLATPIHCVLTKQLDDSYALVWSRKDTETEAAA